VSAAIGYKGRERALGSDLKGQNEKKGREGGAQAPAVSDRAGGEENAKSFSLALRGGGKKREPPSPRWGRDAPVRKLEEKRRASARGPSLHRGRCKKRREIVLQCYRNQKRGNKKRGTCWPERQRGEKN